MRSSERTQARRLTDLFAPKSRFFKSIIVECGPRLEEQTGGEEEEEEEEGEGEGEGEGEEGEGEDESSS